MSPAPDFHQPSPGLTDAFHNASSNITSELYWDIGFHKLQANKAKVYKPCSVIQVQRTLSEAASGLPKPLAKSHSISTIQWASTIYSELPANDGNTARCMDHGVGLNALAILVADTRPNNYVNEYDSELVGMVIQKASC